MADRAKAKSKAKSHLDKSKMTPNQRGLIMSCCAQVSNLSDLMHAELDYLTEQGEGATTNE